MSGLAVLEVLTSDDKSDETPARPTIAPMTPLPLRSTKSLTAAPGPDAAATAEGGAQYSGTSCERYLVNVWTNSRTADEGYDYAIVVLLDPTKTAGDLLKEVKRRVETMELYNQTENATMKGGDAELKHIGIQSFNKMWCATGLHQQVFELQANQVLAEVIQKSDKICVWGSTSRKRTREVEDCERETKRLRVEAPKVQKMMLPGALSVGDRVKARVPHSSKINSIHLGAYGTVRGPASQYQDRHDGQRVALKFDCGSCVDMVYWDLEKLPTVPLLGGFCVGDRVRAKIQHVGKPRDARKSGRHEFVMVGNTGTVEGCTVDKSNRRASRLKVVFDNGSVLRVLPDDIEHQRSPETVEILDTKYSFIVSCLTVPLGGDNSILLRDLIIEFARGQAPLVGDNVIQDPCFSELHMRKFLSKAKQPDTSRERTFTMRRSDHHFKILDRIRVYAVTRFTPPSTEPCSLVSCEFQRLCEELGCWSQWCTLKETQQQAPGLVAPHHRQDRTIVPAWSLILECYKQQPAPLVQVAQLP